MYSGYWIDAVDKTWRHRLQALKVTKPWLKLFKSSFIIFDKFFWGGFSMRKIHYLQKKLKKWSSFSKITFFPLLRGGSRHQSKFSTFFLNPSLTYVPTFFPSRPFLHFLWPETTRSARKIFSTAAYHCTLNDISNQILQSHFDEGREFYIQDIHLLFAFLYYWVKIWICLGRLT